MGKGCSERLAHRQWTRTRTALGSFRFYSPALPPASRIGLAASITVVNGGGSLAQANPRAGSSSLLATTGQALWQKVAHVIVHEKACTSKRLGSQALDPRRLGELIHDVRCGRGAGLLGRDLRKALRGCRPGSSPRESASLAQSRHP
jgi:hypothetical protein